MRCPSCQFEVGEVDVCPACQTKIVRTPPVVVEPAAPVAPVALAAPVPVLAPPAAAPPVVEPPAAVEVAAVVPVAKAADPRRQAIIYGGIVVVAISIGFSGAALVEHFANPAADPCLDLCSYAALPQTAGNANLAAQLRSNGCSCTTRAAPNPIQARPPPPPLPGALPRFPEPEGPPGSGPPPKAP